MILRLQSSLGRYGSDYGVMLCDDCSYCGTMIDCSEPVPGYVTLNRTCCDKLHYGMPLALFVS